MVSFLLICLLKFAMCECASILVLVLTPMYSHQVTIRPIYLELAKRGHNVTVVTLLQLDKSPKNYTEMYMRRTFELVVDKFLEDDMKDAKDIRTQQITVFENGKMILESLLGDEMKDLIESGRKFDLLINEVCARFGMIFSEIFQAPMVLISSFGGMFDTFSTVGSPVHPILYPIGIREKFRDLTMLDKVVETYRHFDMVKLFYDMGEFDEEVVRKHLGDAFPSIDVITSRIELILLNVHPLWDSNRPVSSNLIYLGGLHLQQKKELPQELRVELDTSPGAIYMSFGSTVRSSIISQGKIDMFLKVLSKIPYTVFWRWDADVEDVPRNVIIRKWFPQADLLRHPKVKLFITQGGLQSVDEAVDAMVPMVGVPILFDQWYNVDKMVELKIGVKCDVHTVTEEEFKTAVDNVLTDARYRKNIERLRRVVTDKMHNSLERAIYWIECVITHKGATRLRSTAFHLTTREYFDLDLIFSLILITLFLILVIIRIFSLFCKCKIR